MTLKEFAGMFGMSAKGLCEYTGFSRQGLNEIVKGNSKKAGVKKDLALRKLLQHSTRIREQEVKDATKRESERTEMLLSVF